MDKILSDNSNLEKKINIKICPNNYLCKQIMERLINKTYICIFFVIIFIGKSITFDFSKCNACFPNHIIGLIYK